VLLGSSVVFSARESGGRNDCHIGRRFRAEMTIWNYGVVLHAKISFKGLAATGATSNSVPHADGAKSDAQAQSVRGIPPRVRRTSKIAPQPRGGAARGKMRTSDSRSPPTPFSELPALTAAGAAPTACDDAASEEKSAMSGIRNALKFAAYCCWSFGGTGGACCMAASPELWLSCGGARPPKSPFPRKFVHSQSSSGTGCMPSPKSAASPVLRTEPRRVLWKVRVPFLVLVGRKVGLPRTILVSKTNRSKSKRK
jgi:hypothetical protein